jgi:bifunctional N-acetylglucosamine-1-phosphate-uridyltransferase/glucosamine-1-phosphate-acetyltransferase GlmU-like protein
MEIIEVNGERYLVKRKFSKDRIKDIKILSEMKSFYISDVVLQSANHNTVILAQHIPDAIIIEDIVND